MNGFEEVPCNLCGSNRKAVVYERPYTVTDPAAFAATTDEFTAYGRIVRCQDCGLTFTSPRPTAASLALGYAESSDEAYLAESSSRSINAHISLNVLKEFAPSGKLLEVGASVGYFLNAARSDFEVSGLELSAWAREHAKKRFGLELSPEPLENAPYPPASFDVVAMIDVIEHLTDPKGAVRAAARLLKPGGLLYIVTPDIGSLSAGFLGSYWWGLRPAHIYYFDEERLRGLLEGEGFEIVLSKSFGRIFSYGYWASRLRHYPKWFYGAVRGVISSLGLERKLLYLDTRDSIEICARKR